MTSSLDSMSLPISHRRGILASAPARVRTNIAPAHEPSKHGPATADTFCFGRYRLLVRERLLLKDDTPVRVGSRAFDLLRVLVERAGQTVSRQELFERVWPDVIVAKVNLRVHVAGLRKALGDGRDGNRFVICVAGRGYGFVAPVSRLNSLTETVAPRRPQPRFGRDIAFAIAHALAADFDSAVCFVDLAGINDPARVTMAVAAALGYEVEPQQSRTCVLSCLKDKKLLLVLDNCERVLIGIAQLIEQLLTEAPQVQVLIGSRKAPPI